MRTLLGVVVSVLIGVLVGMAVVSLSPARLAGACSCAVFTMDSSVERSVAAFVGVARDEHGGDGALGQPRGWTFEVTEVVKGELPPVVEVWQDLGGACGPSFEVGELVGVVLFGRDGDRYLTNDCGGVWRADELRTPGAVAAPTGGGPVALIAAGRSGPAILAAYDADGNLAAWALGGDGDALSNLRVCPGSKVFVGTTLSADRPGAVNVVRRDVATLLPLESVALPHRPESSWPSITDTRGFHCTTSDGDVVFLVSASGSGVLPGDNVVIWVDGPKAVTYPVDHGWGVAPAADGTSVFLLSGELGTTIERLTLADGNRQRIAELPDQLGGRLIAVDQPSGRLAVIATSNPSSESRGDRDAPDDHLVVLSSEGDLLSTAPLPAPRLAHSVEWLDAEHLLVVWGLPSTIVDIITLDGTVQSTLTDSVDPNELGYDLVDLAVVGQRVYSGNEDGVVSFALDGADLRRPEPSIARVLEVAAVLDGPIADPQPVPTIPAARQTPPDTSHPTPAVASSSAATTPAPERATAADAGAPVAPGVTADDDDRGAAVVIILVAALAVAVVVVATVFLRRRRRRHLGS